jgi:hypothetical protein
LTDYDFLYQIIQKYLVNNIAVQAQVESIIPIIQNWGNKNINEIIYSGSFAKGTSVALGTDADVFVSLSSNTPDTLSEIFNSLFTAFSLNRYHVRRQNVSVGITFNGYDIDIVPGKRQSQYGYDHSLYKNKANTWTKTNIKTHISHVANSNRLDEIKLIKIWRHLNNLEFPSFYLEMVVIDSLSGCSYTDLGGNVWKVLGFLSDGFTNRRYIDPANSNNIISDDINIFEKLLIQRSAQVSREKKNWNEIVW